MHPRQPPDFQPVRWEFATSLNFDWDFITGKKKFRWPMVSKAALKETRRPIHPLIIQIFYFANRYFLLFALIGMYVPTPPSALPLLLCLCARCPRPSR